MNDENDEDDNNNININNINNNNNTLRLKSCTKKRKKPTSSSTTTSTHAYAHAHNKNDNEEEEEEEGEGEGEGDIETAVKSGSGIIKSELLLSSIPEIEMKSLISSAIKVALASSKTNKPFTKKEISDKLSLSTIYNNTTNTNNINIKSILLNHIFQQMEKKLTDIFGFEVKELEMIDKPKQNIIQERKKEVQVILLAAAAVKKKQSTKSKSNITKKKKKKKSNQYMLINGLGHYYQNEIASRRSNNNNINDDDDDGLISLHSIPKEDGVLAIVLALIFVSGRTIDDKTLETYMNSLGIRSNNNNNNNTTTTTTTTISNRHSSVMMNCNNDDGGFCLGDLLKYWISLKHLVKIVTPGPDGDITEYKWGQRAIAEWNEKNMIKFITDIWEITDENGKKHLEAIIKAAAETDIIPTEDD